MIDSMQNSDAWALGARLTALFDWQAIGAIGTVGALLLIARQADRTGRLMRARRREFLVALARAIDQLSFALQATACTFAFPIPEGDNLVRVRTRLTAVRIQFLAIDLNDPAYADLGYQRRQGLDWIAFVEREVDRVGQGVQRADSLQDLAQRGKQLARIYWDKASRTHGWLMGVLMWRERITER